MQARLLAGFKRIVCACDRIRECNLNNIYIRSFCNNSSPAIKRVYVQRGPGFWKINDSLLSDKRFIQDLSSKIPEFKTKHDYLDDKGLSTGTWLKWRWEVSVFNIQSEKTEIGEIPKTLPTTNWSVDEPAKDWQNKRKHIIRRLYRLRDNNVNHTFQSLRKTTI